MLTEDVSSTPDEGVTKFALALTDRLQQWHAVKLLSTESRTPSPPGQLVRTRRTFVGRALRAELRNNDPEVVIYVSRTSATFFAFLRARVLKLYCPRAQIVVIALQARRHPRWQQRVIRRLVPDQVFVQSTSSQKYLEGLGCHVGLLPSGVDLQTFCPLPPAQRHELRQQYGLTGDKPIVLHVGHLVAGRGIRVLSDLAATGACQVLLVASASTQHDRGLAAELRGSGVTVLSEYLPHVEQLYQLADCYVFPVESTDNAIGVPLSVLEALACDLPVVTTRFGGLPRVFGEQEPGLMFVDAPGAIVPTVLRVAEGARHGATRGQARPLAMRFGWDAVAASLLDQLEPDWREAARV